MLSAHYRNPVNFSHELLDQAKSALERLYNAKNNLEHLLRETEDRQLSSKEQELYDEMDGYIKKFEEAMDDDINTADALAVIFDLVRDANTHLSGESSKKLVQKIYDVFNALTGILGIAQKEQEKTLDEEIEALIEKAAGQSGKDWATADKIRDDLENGNNRFTCRCSMDYKNK